MAMPRRERAARGFGQRERGRRRVGRGPALDRSSDADGSA